MLKTNYFTPDEYTQAENAFLDKMQKAEPLTLAEEGLIALGFAYGCNFALERVRATLSND